jgi:hypothetical protein
MAAPSQIINSSLYWEKDTTKKNYNWAHELCTLFRQEWKPVVDRVQAEEGMKYLLSEQSLEKVKSGFEKSGSFATNTEWIAIGVLDRIRNILIAEFLKGVYKPQVEAVDVGADNQRKKDRTLLAGRSTIEGVITDLNRRTGDPPYKMDSNVFEGNVDAFDQLGLDADNPDDRNFFFSTFHRLWHEIDAQELLAALMQHNEFENYVEDLVNDILAKMCVSFQVYASQFTGEIKWHYLKPEDMRAIEGTRPDFKDAVTLGYEKKVSVRQFLDFAGPEFDWVRDRKALANAINTVNGTNYAFVSREGCYEERLVDSGEGGYKTDYVLVASYGTMLKHTVQVGYMEWKSVDQVVKKLDRETGFLYPLDPRDKGKEFNPNGRYGKDISEYFKTYKTWFIDTGGATQMIFRFGPLYHMLSHGAYDEYSSFSLHIYRSKGRPATKIVKPFVDIANKAFYKMLWAIDESTPRVRVLHYDSIAQLVKKLAPKQVQPSAFANAAGQMQPARQSIAGQIEDVLSHYRNSLVHLYSTPEVDGRQMGGNGRPHYIEEGGLDPLAPAMQTVLDWAEAQVSVRLGINGPRDAYTPDPKDGYKKNMAAVEQSRNATYYIPFMLRKIMLNSCTASLNLAQDGIEYETPVLSFLENLIGTDSLESFRSLNKVPMHSYGIYVDIFNTQQEKDRFMMLVDQAYQRREITISQYTIIQNMDDVKKAGLMLAYYQMRNERQVQKQADAQHQRTLQEIQAKNDADLAVIDRKGQWEVRARDTQGKWYFRGQQDKNMSDQERKRADIDSNRQRQQEKADAEISVEKARKSLDNIQPLAVSDLGVTPAPVNVPTPGLAGTGGGPGRSRSSVRV